MMKCSRGGRPGLDEIPNSKKLVTLFQKSKKKSFFERLGKKRGFLILTKMYSGW